MQPRPYLLLGDSDRRFIAQRVETALSAWRREWLADAAAEPALAAASDLRAERWLTALAPAGAPPASPRGAPPAPHPAPQLLLGCRAGWRSQLGSLISAEPPRHGPRAEAPLATKLCEAMLESLALHVLRSISSGAAPQLRWDGEGAPQAWGAAGAGAVLYDLSPALPLGLALAPELVAASLPRRAASRAGREPLAPLARAVEPCAVGLEAVLGEAELDLGELAHLEVGHVIVLDRGLQEPLALRLEAGEPVAAVHLGTRAGRKTVQLVGRAHNRNPT